MISDINFAEMPDNKLQEWLNGTNANIGSLRYYQAKDELDNRRLKSQLDKLDNLISSINSLKETWPSKAFWLVVIAILVGILINILSQLIIDFLQLNVTNQ